MASVNLSIIQDDECIGASLPKINGNFYALSAAFLQTSVTNSTLLTGISGASPINVTTNSNGAIVSLGSSVPYYYGGAGGLATGLLKSNGDGTTSLATGGTDYVTPASLIVNLNTLNPFIYDYIVSATVTNVSLDDRYEVWVQGQQATNLGSGTSSATTIEVKWLPNEMRYGMRFSTNGGATWTYGRKLGKGNYNPHTTISLHVNNDGGSSHTHRFASNSTISFTTKTGRTFTKTIGDSLYFNGFLQPFQANVNYAAYNLILDSSSNDPARAIMFRWYNECNSAGYPEGLDNW